MADPSTGAALRDYLAAQHRELVANLPGLRDVEPVHHARTRARRIRSVLGAFGDHTPEAGRLSRNLRWLGRTIGRLRDLDVIRARLGSTDLMHASVPDLVPDLVDHERAAVLDEVRSALDRPRSAHVLDDLAALVEPAAWGGLAEEPLANVAPRVLAAERERVLRRDRVAADPAENRTDRLHDVRKAAKRLRYAAEAAGPDHQDHADRARALQDLLGEANDALRTAAWLDHASRAHPALAERLAAEANRQWAAGRVDPAAYERAVQDLRGPDDLGTHVATRQ